MITFCGNSYDGVMFIIIGSQNPSDQIANEARRGFVGHSTRIPNEEFSTLETDINSCG